MEGGMALRILLADDEQVFLNRLEQLLLRISGELGIHTQIQTYTRQDIGSAALSAFDLAFLDLDFGAERGAGLEIARRIRKHRSDTLIIFVTNYIEYAPEGYELNAFRYLLKSELNTKLRNYFCEALEQLRARRETITIQNGGEWSVLPIDNILFLEADKHIVAIRMCAGKRKEYRCYATLQSFAQKLEASGFLRIHKSYLVNMRHIARLQCSEAVLDTGLVLSVSERNYAEIKKKFLLWKGKQLWNT